MPLTIARPSMAPKARMNAKAGLGLAVVVLFFLLTGTISYYNLRVMRDGAANLAQTHDMIASLDELFSTLQDAETGQRGFLLTGKDQYLVPYQNAVSDVEAKLRAVTAVTENTPVQRARLVTLRRHADAKLDELQRVIDLRRAAGMTAAAEMVGSDRGKAEMDAIRAQIALLKQDAERLRFDRLGELAGAYRTAWFTGTLTCLLGVLITLLVGVLVQRAAAARDRKQWLQNGQAGLGIAMLGEQSTRELGENILAFLSKYVGAQGGVIFSGNNGLFQRIADFGVPADAKIVDQFKAKEGLLGQAAWNRELSVLNDIPDGYLMIGSALGRDKPRHLAIAPAVGDDVVQGVVELGFLQPVGEHVLDFLNQSSGAIAIALRSARFRTELQDLLEETQRQSEELQTQSEELRVSNEELEEQGRALKESQVRLEQQQAELEQTNVQLEEQAERLAIQRDDLALSNAANELKTRELEQASRYKSDFLANMSHELRTPLNSLLILSKLLGDNAQGNLNDEQVKFANTIEASGNDLLALINDILDLSKIEAGHVEIRPETITLNRLATDMRQLFQPVADERGLRFDVVVGDDVPATIGSDRQRLEQILKNLLSNAFKFTRQGGVSFEIARTGHDSLELSVTDTGIGIAEDQQAEIFKAFHQADGSISREYGGTGLGLSISRELARLLGGTITLKSNPLKGSCFTLSIPISYDPTLVAPREEPAPRSSSRSSSPALSPLSRAAKPKPLPRKVEDDRDKLSQSARVLLVVEDDESFALIVRDLSRELGFECLIASTAEEALQLARAFKPQAVVLDVGLPDQSGLAVLDQLKRDVGTRHIPIHVVSANDHSQTALSLGAIGYLLKPVKREALAEVLEKIAEKLTRRVRRVLIVEDDSTQREAVAKLIGSSEIETVGVGTAAECLARLSQETFDCMVLDLTLPDASGFDLLETLNENPSHSFPPVIVYTGQDLSMDDEQRLRRYSDSIIVKGARSPERLLDEVSLFLHQVVTDLPLEHQKMIKKSRDRDAILEGRRILIVEDDVRNVYSLTNILEPRGAVIEIARNGREAIEALEKSAEEGANTIDLVLMDVMMPVMDGLTATQEIRKDGRWKKLPIITLTAKAMPDDQQRCIEAGANDYMAKPIDVDKLLSLVRVWMAR